MYDINKMTFNNLLNLITNDELIFYLNSRSLDLGIIPGINDDIKNILEHNFNITTTIQLYGQFMLLFENSINHTTQNFYLWLCTHLNNIEQEKLVKIACSIKEKLELIFNMN
jgi:hypothetical protein